MTTLAESLVSVADKARGLHETFGMRPYRVYIVRQKWSGGARGEGDAHTASERLLTPTPSIGEFTNLAQALSAVGRHETGELLLSGVSLRYTEDDLLPHDIRDDESFFYEVREAGRPVRRFFPSSTPHRDAGNAQWTVRVTQQEPDRKAAASRVPWRA